MNNFCTRRIVYCRLECGAKCHFNTRTQHEVDLCPMRQVTCVDCGEHMLGKIYKKKVVLCCYCILFFSFFFFPCFEMLIFFFLHLFFYFLAKLMSKHLLKECLQRIVFCACNGGCGHRGPFILNHTHETTECLLRPLPCRYNHLGCEIIIGKKSFLFFFILFFFLVFFFFLFFFTSFFFIFS